MGGARAATALTALLSGAVTVAAVLLPQAGLVYRGPASQVALETAATLVALLATFLVVGRLRRRTRVSELMLACSLAVLALSNLFFIMMPLLTGLSLPGLTVWGMFADSSLSGLLFSLAAFVPCRPLRSGSRAAPVAAAGVVAALLLTAIVMTALRVRAPPGPGPAQIRGLPVRPSLSGSRVLLALELTNAGMYALAAAGFLRRSRQLSDALFGWLAIAGVLAAASHVNYFLYLPSYAPLVSTGDIFRLVFSMALFTGFICEIRSYWHALSDAAVLRERQRIARDLHDGLAQELAYLARNLDSLSGAAGDDTIQRLRRAAERARLEWRLAITTLAASGRRAADVALAEAAGEIAERFRIRLDLDLTAGVTLPSDRTEALVRIACEAIANAARHSGDSKVSVCLDRHGTRVRLRISDSGQGFDPSSPGRGFGLTSMRERASAAGGELWIRSEPGCGAEVEVAL